MRSELTKGEYDALRNWPWRNELFRSKGEYDRASEYHDKADPMIQLPELGDTSITRIANALSTTRGLRLTKRDSSLTRLPTTLSAIRSIPLAPRFFAARSATYRATGNLKRASEDYAEAVRLEPRVVRANQASEKRQGTRSRGAR